MRARRPPPDRARAWVYALTNQLAFPGLGTVLAGRRVGYAQATLMVAGFCLFVGMILWVLIAGFRLAMDGNADADELAGLWWRHAGMGMAGLVLCGLAWLWALASSIALVREARPAPDPLPQLPGTGSATTESTPQINTPTTRPPP